MNFALFKDVNEQWPFHFLSGHGLEVRIQTLMCSFFFFFFNIFFLTIFAYLFIYLWLSWVFVSVRGFSPVAASGGHSSSWCAGPLTIVASLVAEHRLQMRRLSSCGSRAQLLRGMWDLPRPGLEPVSPALAGRFSTTAPPGKPDVLLMYHEPADNNMLLCPWTYWKIYFLPAAADR